MKFSCEILARTFKTEYNDCWIIFPRKVNKLCHLGMGAKKMGNVWYFPKRNVSAMSVTVPPVSAKVCQNFTTSLFGLFALALSIATDQSRHPFQMAFGKSKCAIC